MNATAVLPPALAAYLDQVRASLADLPAEDRDELLADVEVSLLEDPPAAPELRLGPPERFAQELRAAAGLEPVAQPGLTPGASLWTRLRPHLERARRTALELAPAWWIARGYFAACALALLVDLSWSERVPLVPVRGWALAGLALVAVAVAASVWIGLRRSAGTPVLVLNVVVALAAVPVLVQIADGRAYRPPVAEQEFEVMEPVQGLAVNGEPIRNVYPYDRNGRLLLDVLLYDDLGRPLEIGSADPQMDPLRRQLFSEDGAPLLHAYPIRYFDPGTSRVADPLAAPREIKVPEITTPPLKRP